MTLAGTLAAAWLSLAGGFGSVQASGQAPGQVPDPGSTQSSARTVQAPADSLPQPQAAGQLRVFLVTLGPGSQVWERFGHNALWIHDPARGTDVAYHYGLFDMSEAGFMTEFLQGRMAYSMGAADARALVDAYRRVGRDATVQELSLTGAEARALQSFLEWNMIPDNRVYRYDYFRDNCSTRVRDALDRALDGRLAVALERDPTGITYRSEALALTAGDGLLTTGLDLALGPLADQDLTRWELAFIPMRLRDAVADLSIPRETGPEPLVVREQRLPAYDDGAAGADPHPGVTDAASAAGTRAPEAPAEATGTRHLHRAGAMLLLGLVLGGLMVLLGRMARRGTVGRVAFGLAGALWGGLSGVLGVVLLGLWLFTDHEFAHANENLLQANPLALGLVILVPAALNRRVGRAAWRLAAVLAAFSVAGLLLLPLPVTPQSTLAVIALALPIHVGLLIALRPLPREDAGAG